jgi:modulator of drug activity B
MKANQKVLLINTHLTYPGWTEGKLNDSFIEVAKNFFLTKGFEVLETNVETGYTPEEEVAKHLAASIVILQTPINWFGAPWIYKKYVDEVFNHGLQTQQLLRGDGRSNENPTSQYGSGGLMQGKKFMICATWNAPAEAFDNPTQQLMQGKGTADLFLNISSNYRFSGYDVVKDYNCFNIFRRDNISEDLDNYPKYLAEIFEL